MSFFAIKYRRIGTNPAMNHPLNDRVIHTQRGKNMELFIFLGIFVAWVILQAWVLPRFGVKT